MKRHLVPLLGTRRVKDLTKPDVIKALKDIMAGKTAMSKKTKALRGKAIVKGGPGTAARTIGLLGGMTADEAATWTEAGLDDSREAPPST